MLLENIDIEIPSDDWVLVDYQQSERKEDSDEDPWYFADVQHQPTGLVVTVSGYLYYDFTCSVVYADRHAPVSVEQRDALIPVWNAFIVESIPALRAFHHTLPNVPGLEFMRTMYDKDDLEFWYISSGVVDMLVADFRRGKRNNA